MNKHKNQVLWLNRNILGFSYASFLADLSYEMTTLILPFLLASVADQSAIPLHLGFIVGFADGGSSLVRILSGYLSDKIKKRKYFIALGYALTSFFIALMGFGQSVRFVVWSRFLGWLGKGLREPARDALIAESTDKMFYGRVFGFHRAMDTLGALCGPIITIFLINFVKIRAIFLISFIPGFFSVLMILYMVSDVYQNKKDRNSLRVYGVIRLMPLNFFIFAIIILFFSIGFFHPALMILQVQKTLGFEDSSMLSASMIACYTLFNLCRAIAEYIVGSLSDKFERRYLLAFFGMMLFGVTSLLLSVAQDWFFFILVFI